MRITISSFWDVDIINIWNKVDKLNNPELETILYSLLVRKSFGGMKGDMGMFQAIIKSFLNQIEMGEDIYMLLSQTEAMLKELVEKAEVTTRLFGHQEEI